VTEGSRKRGGASALVVGALGVVYGDLGTSPLYSIREAFESPSHRLEVDRLNVFGAISIIVWTLTLIVAVKYVLLVLRADNNGEGGILVLTALVSGRPSNGRPDGGSKPSRIGVSGLVFLGLFGTALLFGDGMITPAISVLSAVEGVTLIRPGLRSVVVPISVLILVILFVIQRFGTGRVGRIFGPIMVLWFGVLTVLGVVSVVRTPEILSAANPVHAARYFADNGVKGFLSMGSLFLVVTGGEALYADMGHFGRRPIRQGWFVIVMPALFATYFGIGALLLREPQAIRSPFFLLAPSPLRLPLIVLATAATVIASQALISGVFSLTSQAVRLGYAPRTNIVYTSSTARGQIYVPVVNWGLMIACVGLVVAFGSSARLAAAFGLSVTGTMFITTILFAVHSRKNLGWNPIAIALLAGVVLFVEGAFLAANAFKFVDGGWFPLAVGVLVVLLFTTWKAGRSLVAAQIAATRTPLSTYVAGLEPGRVVRVPGIAVFLYSQRLTTPPSLAALVRTTRALHDVVYVVRITVDETPRVDPSQRVVCVPVGNGVFSVTIHYGFMDETTVAADLEKQLEITPASTDYILGRESIIATGRPGMARWREVLYSLMVRNASDVATSFHLPTERVFEVGTRVEI
jgi:KUP system potassium uptake protein